MVCKKEYNFVEGFGWLNMAVHLRCGKSSSECSCNTSGERSSRVCLDFIFLAFQVLVTKISISWSFLHFLDELTRKAKPKVYTRNATTVCPTHTFILAFLACEMYHHYKNCCRSLREDARSFILSSTGSFFIFCSREWNNPTRCGSLCNCTGRFSGSSHYIAAVRAQFAVQDSSNHLFTEAVASDFL